MGDRKISKKQMYDKLRHIYELDKIEKFYPLIFYVFFIVYTYISYKLNIWLFNGTQDSLNTYSFVWKVVMVFSLDIAITQLLHHGILSTKYNSYLGINTYQLLGKSYINIHNFIRSLPFYVLFGCFIFLPLFMYSNPHLSYRILPYFWQADYLTIIIIIFTSFVTDLNFFHTLNEILGYRNSLLVKNIVTRKLRKGLHKDNEFNNTGLDYFCKCIKYLFNSIENYKQPYKFIIREKLKVFKLGAKIIFNIDTYHRNNNLDEFKTSSIYINFINVLLNDIGVEGKKDQYISDSIENISCLYSKFMSKVAFHDKNIKLDLLPYKLITDSNIFYTSTWIHINKMFEKNLFVQDVLSSNSVALKQIEYRSNNYRDNNSLMIVRNNIKKLFDNEMVYIHFEHRYGMSDAAAKSLKSIFTKSFKDYINDGTFKKVHPKLFEYLSGIKINTQISY